MSSATKQQQQRKNSSKLDSPYMDLPQSVTSRRSHRIAEERRGAGGWSASGGFSKTGGTGHQLRDRHSLNANVKGGLGKYAFQVMKNTSTPSKSNNGSGGKERRSSLVPSFHSEEGSGMATSLSTSLPQLLPTSNSSATVSTQGTHLTATYTGTPPTIHEQQQISQGSSMLQQNLGACLAQEDVEALALHHSNDSPAQSQTTRMPRRELSLDDITSASVYFDAAQTETEREALASSPSPAAWTTSNHFTTTMSAMSLSLRDCSIQEEKKKITAVPQYLSCQGLVKDATPGMEQVLSGLGLALFAPLDGAPLRPQALDQSAFQDQQETPLKTLDKEAHTNYGSQQDACSPDADSVRQAQALSLTSASGPTAVQPQRQHHSKNDAQSSASLSPFSLPPQHIVTPAPPTTDIHAPGTNNSHSSSSHSIRQSSSFIEECLFPVDVVPEPQDVMEDCPRLLSEAVMQYLTEHGLPVVIKMRRWVRAYSLARDGDSFEMMMTLVSPHKFSLMVVKTTQGEVFGGFVDSPWDSGKAFGFYGGGQAFLFSLYQDPTFDYNGNGDGDGDQQDSDNKNTRRHIKTSPKLSSSSLGEGGGHQHEEQVTIYGWTGANTYFQVCDESKGSFAMGGGGADGTFGLCVEDCFWKGSTGPCDTYGNAPLAKQQQFEIVDFEVYGFWF
jgi:hypothetical protein